MRTLKWLALSLAVAGLGCGGDDDKICADGGTGCVSDAAAGTDGPMQWGLTPGTNQYKVTAISMSTDGCMIMPGAVVGMTLPLTYEGGKVSIGTTMGTPPQPSLGSGMASGNKATLTNDNIVGDMGCTYSRKVTSQFELFGHDKFTLAATENEAMFSAGCGTDVPPGGVCTSTWTWTLEKQ
jgi:hypothetical protein